MPRSPHARLEDVLDAIGQIRLLLRGKSLAHLQQDRVSSAAFERFLEIISEATRHVPIELKELQPNIPWRRIADLGNWLRHVYDRVDGPLLWAIYTDDLGPLEHAVRSMIEAIGPTDRDA